jgi:hypothetical protein
MNGETAGSCERILSYVYYKQQEYVEGEETHPFMEQTLVNIAIFYRQQ